jgi:hypothetical protein
MDADLHAWIARFHRSPVRCVMALTGGGSLAAAQLLHVPGSSRTLLEVIIPYHEQSLADFLGQRTGSSCSKATSQALARRAFERARWLCPGDRVLGLGCTASLASDRPKKGEHRCHISIHLDDATTTWSANLAKDARSRAEEETLVAAIVLHALASRLGLPAPPMPPLHEGESIVSAGDTSTASGFRETYVAIDGQWRQDKAWESPAALLPGSFNPLHAGHLRLARYASKNLGMPAEFELSVANVDKPDLDIDEVRRRVQPFCWQAPVWLTRAPRFVQKAKRFPGAVFVVGVDTAMRVVSPRYYDNDEARLRQALAEIRAQGCRFLVACRVDSQKRYLSLRDAAVPAEFTALFTEIPPEHFRFDVSSTELRSRGS